MKRPAFQWYPGDHRRDTGVQMCSFEARALWREMLDLMHDGEPRGFLTAGGAEITLEQLARHVGADVKKVRGWIKELEDRKVFSRRDDGVIYSRRMMRDEHVSQVRAEAGKKGGGNPNLFKQNGSKGPSKHEASPEQIEQQKAPPAVADCGLRSAVAVALSAVSNRRSSNTPSNDDFAAANGHGSAAAAAAAPPASAGALTGLGTVHPDVAAFVRTYYGDANPTRQLDVLRQLLATLGEGAQLDRGARVRAISPERLVEKCREVIGAGVRNHDKAIRVLLLKLNDAKDVTERAAQQDTATRDADERETATELASAEAWLADHDDTAHAIDVQLEQDGFDAKNVGRPFARMSRVLEAWRLAGKPEPQHTP